MDEEIKEEFGIVVHRTPAIDDNCEHEWGYITSTDEIEGIEPSHCRKCRISWTRYIFCCCP